MRKLLCKICFLGLFVCFNSVLWAQENGANEYDKVSTKELFISISPHTLGASIGVDYGFIRNTLIHSVHLELTSLRHHKEVRQRNAGGVGSSFNNVSRSFAYGKEHQFYGIHLGYSGKFNFAKKAQTQGLAISASYAAGPSLGLVRPYYLDLRVGQNEVVSQVYSEENATIFLNPGNINGASGLTHGWDELSFVPGGFVKFGLNFSWGNSLRFIKAVDVGVMLNVYTKEIPIMLITENQAIFPTLYAAFQIGKRR